MIERIGNNRLQSGKMSRADRLIAVGQRRADQVVQEWADLGDRFVFYALAKARAEGDKRLDGMEVAHPDFKFGALFNKALKLDPKRAFDVLSEMQGDPEILARNKALAFGAVRELELASECEKNAGWVRQAVSNALGSLVSFVSFAD